MLTWEIKKTPSGMGNEIAAEKACREILIHAKDIGVDIPRKFKSECQYALTSLFRKQKIHFPEGVWEEEHDYGPS